MSEQMTAKVDVDLAQPSILSRRNPLRYVLLLVQAFVDLRVRLAVGFPRQLLFRVGLLSFR